jgi:hypothetical protein
MKRSRRRFTLEQKAEVVRRTLMLAGRLRRVDTGEPRQGDEKIAPGRAQRRPGETGRVVYR